MNAWIPGALRNPLNRGKGEHWAVTARERKQWREKTQLIVAGAMRKAGIPVKWAAEPKHIVLTAYVWNEYDEDGLAAALKSVVDGLKDAQLIQDDGPKSGHTFERRQVVSRTRRGVAVGIRHR